MTPKQIKRLKISRLVALLITCALAGVVWTNESWLVEIPAVVALHISSAAFGMYILALDPQIRKVKP